MKLNKYEIKWLKRETLENLKLDRSPVRLNEKDYFLINEVATVDRKYVRFMQYLREREAFEKEWEEVEKCLSSGDWQNSLLKKLKLPIKSD